MRYMHSCIKTQKGFNGLSGEVTDSSNAAGLPVYQFSSRMSAGQVLEWSGDKL